MMPSSLTITEALRHLEDGSLTPSALVAACIEQIEAVDATLNAVVHKNFDRALEQAKKLETSPRASSPLWGIPYLAKDVYSEAGVPTTACSNILRNKQFVPVEDSTTTQRLKGHGAISLGKTNTDEFTMGGSTETSCYGVTKNPWDTTRVAGGSSGGAAAAVAADECLFSLGTDTGGSIRQPAAFCGITGIRPTYGRTSRYGVMSMASSLDTIGPLAKTVEDLSIILEAIAGKDPLDATTSDVPVPSYRTQLARDVKGLRIGLPREYFIDGLDPEIEASVRSAATVFKELGATITDCSLPHTKYALAAYYVLCPSEVSSNMARYDGIRFGHTIKNPKDLLEYTTRVRSEGFGAEVKRRIMIGTYALSAGYFDAYYLQAQKARTLIKKDFDDVWGSVDLLLTPATPSAAFRIGAHANDPVAMYLEDVFMEGVVMAGVPALSVPCGFTKGSLPLGLQIIGPQWEEGRVLRAGYAFEQATEWHRRKPILAGVAR